MLFQIFFALNKKLCNLDNFIRKFMSKITIGNLCKLFVNFARFRSKTSAAIPLFSHHHPSHSPFFSSLFYVFSCLPLFFSLVSSLLPPRFLHSYSIIFRKITAENFSKNKKPPNRELSIYYREMNALIGCNRATLHRHHRVSHVALLQITCRFRCSDRCFRHRLRCLVRYSRRLVRYSRRPVRCSRRLGCRFRDSDHLR